MADIFLNTNTVLGATYDQYGNAMGDYNPVFPYKSSFRLRWQLYTATPGADSDGVDMSSWTKANYSGCGALVTCDNDFVHRLSGSLATGITSGSTISSITVNIGSNRDLVPASGFVTIFNNAGEVKDFAYMAVSFSGNNAELTIGEWTADADYSSGAVARVSQEAYFQAYYNVSLSDPATGLFVFDCVVYSRKVSAAGDAASGQWIDVQGIEILPYKLTDNVYTELPSYLCRTAAISVIMGEAGMNPVVTTPVENMILAFVSSLFSAGADVELYNSSTEQWVPYDEDSEITNIYTKYRWWLNGGDGSVKTELPLINGIDGTDGATWHSGSSSPSSATGNDGDWYVDTSTTDVYRKVSGSWVLQFRLSVLNPSGEWSASVAYPMNALVSYDGSMYIATENTAAGDTPGVSAKWMLYVSKGATGITPHIDSTSKHWMIGSTDTGVVAEAQDGTDGFSPYIGANGNWVDKDGDTGVKAEISGSYTEFSSVDGSGNYTLAGTTTVPYAVLTNAGNFYPVEKGSVTVNTTLNTVTLNVAPYLAYDNAQSFSGTWRLYFAAGSSEVVFNGMPYAALTGAASVTIPAGGSAYTLTIGQDTTITFPSPGNATCYFWLYLTTGSTVYSVTLPNSIAWDDGIGPDLSTASSLYRLAFLWDAPNQKWLGSLFWPAEVLS